MAVKYWTGLFNGEWNAATSWAPIGIPAAGDHVIISGSVDVEPATVTQAIGSINVTSGFTGTIAAAGDPLVVNAGRINFHSSGGAAYFDGEYSVLSVRALHSAALTVDNGLSSAFVYLVTGSVTLDGLYSRVFVGYDSNVYGDTELTHNGSGQIRQYGGYVECSVPAGLVIWDGRCVYNGSFASDPILLMLGGIVEYNADQPLDTHATMLDGTLTLPVGTIPTSGTPMRILGGHLDAVGDFSTFETSGLLVEHMGGEVTLNGIAISLGGYDF